MLSSIVKGYEEAYPKELERQTSEGDKLFYFAASLAKSEKKRKKCKVSVFAFNYKLYKPNICVNLVLTKADFGATILYCTIL